MTRVFISYRRENAGATRSIYDYLVQGVGRENVFYDVDNIPPGVNFKTYLGQEIRASDMVMVVIYKGWSQIKDEDGNLRLENPADFVRIEIETAFAENIPVIPVLVGGARMPKHSELPPSLHDLIFINALELTFGRDFNAQMDRIVDFVSNHRPTKLEKAPTPNRPSEVTPEAAVQESPPEEKSTSTPEIDVVSYDGDFKLTDDITISGNRAVGFRNSLSLFFNNYFNFKGRSSRGAYWWWCLWSIIIGIIVFIIVAPIAAANGSKPIAALLVAVAITNLACFIPYIALGIRRLHDVNRSGWWWLIGFTVIGLIPLLAWTTRSGTSGPNKFGPDIEAGRPMADITISGNRAVGFVNSLSLFFNNYFNFKGRSSRGAYWWACLWSIIIGIIVFIILAAIAAAIAKNSGKTKAALQVAVAIINLAWFIPNISLSIRRLHDVNRSGWWWLIGFTVIGLIPLLVWATRSGTSGPNKFGPDIEAGRQTVGTQKTQSKPVEPAKEVAPTQ